MSLLKLILSLIGPLLLAKFLVDAISLHPSLLDRLLVFCLSCPLARELRLRWEQRQLESRAGARSAILAPLVPSPLPFGLSIVRARLKMIRSGSPADVMLLFKSLSSSSSYASPTTCSLAPDQFLSTDSYPISSSTSTNFKTPKVVRTRVMGFQTIWTLDHDDAKYILSTGFGNFGKSPVFKAGFKRLLGDGVFASDQRGLWAWHRSLTRPHFVRERIADLVAMEEHAKRVADWLVLQVDRQSNAGIVDVQDVFARYTLTVGTQHLFGRCVDSLNDLIHDRPQLGPNAADFAQNFVDAQHWAIINSLLPPFFISLGLYKRDKATEHVLQVVDELVQHASISLGSQMSKKHRQGLDQKEEKDKSDEINDGAAGKGMTSENLLDHLLTSGCSKELVRHECLNILLAARDTTASLLTSCIFELAKDSINKNKMWKKLKEEVERLGSPSFDDLLTIEQVREMKYLRALLNETLRLHPPVWANTRHAFEDDVLPSGVFVPAGADCRFCIREFQRNPEVWGPDAEEFDPDRWIDDRKVLQTKDPFSFQPFSAGPRICLGQQFALTEASIIMIRIIERFEGVDLDNSIESVGVEVPAVVLCFRDGLKVRFKK